MSVRSLKERAAVLAEKLKVSDTRMSATTFADIGLLLYDLAASIDELQRQTDYVQFGKYSRRRY